LQNRKRRRRSACTGHRHCGGHRFESPQLHQVVRANRRDFLRHTIARPSTKGGRTIARLHVRAGTPKPRGSRPSIAALTRAGEGKASEMVRRIQRSVLPSRDQFPGTELQQQSGHHKRQAMRTVGLLVFSLFAFTTGSLAAADVTQTTGVGSWCSPAQNGNGNTVICNGVDPRAGVGTRLVGGLT
jgi:hypothetical protein